MLNRCCEIIKMKITEELITQYAAVSGDTNPIHLLKSAANQAGFPHQVAHGMLSMAIGAKLVSPLIQIGWTLSHYGVKFSSPLFVNDMITIEASSVTQSDKKIAMKVIGKNQEHNKVMHGKLELIK